MSHNLPYKMLLLSMILIYMIPPNLLSLQSALGKGLAIGGLFCLLVFVGRLIFISNFQMTP